MRLNIPDTNRPFVYASFIFMLNKTPSWRFKRRLDKMVKRTQTILRIFWVCLIIFFGLALKMLIQKFMLILQSLKTWVGKRVEKDVSSHSLLHIFNSKILFLDLLITNAGSAYSFPYKWQNFINISQLRDNFIWNTVTTSLSVKCNFLSCNFCCLQRICLWMYKSSPCLWFQEYNDNKKWSGNYFRQNWKFQNISHWICMNS